MDDQRALPVHGIGFEILHAKTADGQKKLCSAGPMPASSTPTLSDALGTATPTREPDKKRKPGGTMDTLTGNALGQ